MYKRTKKDDSANSRGKPPQHLADCGTFLLDMIGLNAEVVCTTAASLHIHFTISIMREGTLHSHVPR